MMKKKEPKTERVTVRLDRDTLRRLEKEARRQKRTVSDVLRARAA
jgi:hypothetical protein